MAKSPVLNVEGKVRKSTIKFAQALLDVGARLGTVRTFTDLDLQSGKDVKLDEIVIKGKKRFNVRLYLNFKSNLMMAQVYTVRGAQMFTEVKSSDELQALCKVWNIATF